MYMSVCCLQQPWSMNCSTIIFPIERELPEEKEHSSFSKRKQSRWINFLVVFDNLQRPDTSHYPSLALEILSAKQKEHLQPWRVVWINILAFATSPNAMWLNNTWRSTKKHSVPMQTLHKYTAHRRRTPNWHINENTCCATQFHLALPYGNTDLPKRI